MQPANSKAASGNKSKTLKQQPKSDTSKTQHQTDTIKATANTPPSMKSSVKHFSSITHIKSSVKYSMVRHIKQTTNTPKASTLSFSFHT
jgi:hypothetical protein